jgi:predicted type IV restriction endonuclease
MDLIDKLKNISESIPKQVEYIKTEEATKNAFVMPFINAIGYNVFDPTEVVPEFIADVGNKKGEKVDYAIMIDGKPSILIECKPCGCDLSKEHASQLCRYFTTTEARFGVLTDGVIYQFYSDIDEPNKMDKKPFLEINMSEIKESQVKELKKFTKSSFDLNEILTTASDLKYTSEIKKIMAREIDDPSEDFVRLFAKQVYSRPVTERVRLKFTGITQLALKQFINDQVSARLKSALEVSNDKNKEEKPEIVIESSKNKIITTEDEWEGYYIIKAILHEIVDPERVALKDTMNYCGILLDNKTNKPISRLHFNSKQKYIGLFDNNKKEEKVPIENIKDIYNYSDNLKAMINIYDSS